MSTLHSKSVIARAAFPLVWSRELSFNRAPPRLVPSPRMLLQRRSYWSIFFFLFLLAVPFYFGFTHTQTYTSLDTLHTRERSRSYYFDWIARAARGQILFFRAISTRHARNLQFQKNEKKNKKKAKETESGAPLALNATECSLSLCHVDRFKWLSDKISRRLVQMYLWRRTKRGRKKRERRKRKKIGPFNSVHSECGVAITPTCVAHVEYT